MGVIFISHSSLDNKETLIIRDWLIEQGWGKSQIFLDLEDLYTGDRWRQQLNAQRLTCEAVILCLSDNWLRSHECVREHTFAEAAGKPILPIIIKSIRERIPTFITDLQFANVADPAFRDEGLSRLKSALQKARIGPAYFPWPPPGQLNRPPYRGLRTLEEADAAIFFGRDAAITRGLDAMRRMRDSAPERILAILGASGAGKSSFLRAGLLARIERDTENYIVLPVFRPGGAALSGPRGLLRAFGVTANVSPKALAARFAAVRAPVIDQLRQHTAAAGEIWNGRQLTLVLPIDQCEELFAAEHAEAESALDLLAAAFAADANIIAALTIRSDSFERLQREPRLAEIPRLPFDLPRLSPAAFKEVIEGPCRLAQPPIEVEPTLTERLLKDLNTPDALPLLAFTLERLVLDYCMNGKLQLYEYEDGLKGLGGALSKAVDATIDAALSDPSLPDTRREVEALIRQAFIPWLVRMDDLDATYKRRIASFSKLPAATRPLIVHLVDQRLLVSDVYDNGEATVEIAHEALLREWIALKGWLDEEREFLLAKSMIERETRKYFTSSPDAQKGSLLDGAQYDSALLVYNSRQDMLSDAERKYIEESRNLIDRKKGYLLARASALDGYVKPLLEKQIEVLKTRIAEVDRELQSISSPYSPGLLNKKCDEAEIDLIKNFSSGGGRWHPVAATHERCLGPHGDYAELYIFPCCGKHVISDEHAPGQFRADGCEPPP